MATAPALSFSNSPCAGDRLLLKSIARTDTRVSDLKATKRHTEIGGPLAFTITLLWLLELEIRTQNKLHAVAKQHSTIRNR